MTRSASPSIRGYQYQFCKSIRELLSFHNDDDILIVEGIEDIETIMGEKHEAVQVKYLESAKLIPSRIREPVCQMLEDYVKNVTDRNNSIYRLYGHFGKGISSEFWNEPEFFDTCRSTIIEDKRSTIVEIKDDVLSAFRGKFELEIGPSISDLQSQVKQLLVNVLDVSLTEVENYYYSNAVNYIIELAIREEEPRRVSKSQFLSGIDNKRILFGTWQKIELGHDKYKRAVKQRIKSDFGGAKKRLVILDTSNLSVDETGYSLTHLIRDILEHHNPINKLDSTEPLTLVINSTSAALKEAKTSILDLGLEFNDGHEDTRFHSGCFNAPIVANVAKRSHKITNVSAHIRVLSNVTYKEFIEKIDAHDTAICISRNRPATHENTVLTT